MQRVTGRIVELQAVAQQQISSDKNLIYKWTRIFVVSWPIAQLVRAPLLYVLPYTNEKVGGSPEFETRLANVIFSFFFGHLFGLQRTLYCPPRLCNMVPCCLRLSDPVDAGNGASFNSQLYEVRFGNRQNGVRAESPSTACGMLSSRN
jgi:hypothetical protein